MRAVAKLDDTATGPFWTPPLPVDRDELSPSILSELDQRGERQSFKGYVLQIYDAPDSKPSGVFEIAFCAKSRTACAIYEAETQDGRDAKRRVVTTDPHWLAAVSPRDAAGTFFQLLVDTPPEA
ncbi:hypothetical protein PZN02_002876 [Sinorhizobium garamanticum]|uniref:Uncharacterized protein n=1 Tax=Sinorhizobium garamanticum TaxID=680247 RepID=A0ABY8DAL1_9HYPH|nr:hypothetical protein [Sinorhizobium garamanticum]WEX86575.1 hypothetical protein PZN02_002876 [Sinorhizobium garamanticum]